MLAGPASTYFVTGDHLGTPVLLTDATGAVANAYDTTPFGQRWFAKASSPTTAEAFPGQLIDIADRYYNAHRDYDPTTGRYLQADPIGLAGGENVYGYVGGNPVGRVDPDGFQAIEPERLAEEISDAEIGAEAIDAQTIQMASAAGMRLPPRFESGSRTVSGALMYQRGVANGIRQAALANQCPYPTGGVYRQRAVSQTMRTGRTSALQRRKVEHGRDPKLRDLDFAASFHTDDYATQRGLEQFLHETENPELNFRNPISPRNKNLDYYIGSAAGYLTTLSK